jgi:predicted RNase H-like HicB family nuclease
MLSGRKPSQPTLRGEALRFSVEIDREDDGRWLAEILEIPGALAYGNTQDDAVAKAYAIALRTVADKLENSSSEVPTSIQLVREIA